LQDSVRAAELYGPQNRNLLSIEQAVGVTINVRGTRVTIEGPDHGGALAANLLEQLLGLLQAGYPLYPPDIAYGIRVLEKQPRAVLKDIPVPEGEDRVTGLILCGSREAGLATDSTTGSAPGSVLECKEFPYTRSKRSSATARIA